MRKPLKSFIPLKDLLSGAMKFRPTPADSWLGVLKEHWTEIAGPSLGGSSRPIRIWKKRLFIGVESSAWASEINLLREELMKKIMEIVPGAGLKEIRSQIV